MNKVLTAILSAAAISFAANVQVLEPSGAEFAPNAPQMVQSILRAAVSQSGNTPVESSSEIQLRTNLMSMGSSIVVVCEQLKGGQVVASGKQKAGSIDDLDVAIEYAAAAALAKVDDGSDNSGVNDAAANSAAYAPEATSQSEGPEIVYVVPVSHGSGEDPNDNFAHKRPTRNYVSYGLGAAYWHNYDYNDKRYPAYSVDMSWEQAFVFHYGRIFEATPNGAITIINNMNISFGDEWEWHETFLIGGRYFFSTGSITPYAGAGLGLGLQTDGHYYEHDEAWAIGLAGGVEAGLVFFRNSATQLELGFAWDALWDGFDSFGRRFGSGSIYVAINY